MKTMFIFLFVLSTSVFAQENIRLSPGASVILSPQTEVRVTCEGTPTTNQTVRYCQCRPNLYNGALADLIQVVKDGQGTIRSQRVLLVGMYFGNCYQAMINHFDCR
jgi:hypothetical protein